MQRFASGVYGSFPPPRRVCSHDHQGVTPLSPTLHLPPLPPPDPLPLLFVASSPSPPSSSRSLPFSPLTPSCLLLPTPPSRFLPLPPPAFLSPPSSLIFSPPTSVLLLPTPSRLPAAPPTQFPALGNSWAGAGVPLRVKGEAQALPLQRLRREGSELAERGPGQIALRKLKMKTPNHMKALERRAMCPDTWQG